MMSEASWGSWSSATRTSSSVPCTGMYTLAILPVLLTCPPPPEGAKRNPWRLGVQSSRSDVVPINRRQPTADYNGGTWKRARGTEKTETVVEGGGCRRRRLPRSQWGVRSGWACSLQGFKLLSWVNKSLQQNSRSH
jgi:hypothetical protein